MATGMCDLGRATELWLNHCKRLALNLSLQLLNILMQSFIYISSCFSNSSYSLKNFLKVIILPYIYHYQILLMLQLPCES